MVLRGSHRNLIKLLIFILGEYVIMFIAHSAFALASFLEHDVLQSHLSVMPMREGSVEILILVRWLSLVYAIHQTKARLW